ncbi:uncharacterized protein LOC119689778 [Teleopsis dalmanni]|uniref:uncharacterized protein LOC119689778 n=1 Tax=Teleopsis dalmanni TaxID=139649 RepID=UPI0018CCECE7|nr:uncharacterized protein LOC119689778 [Teleopsis dalmanni]
MWGASDIDTKEKPHRQTFPMHRELSGDAGSLRIIPASRPIFTEERLTEIIKLTQPKKYFFSALKELAILTLKVFIVEPITKIFKSIYRPIEFIWMVMERVEQRVETVERLEREAEEYYNQINLLTQ